MENFVSANNIELLYKIDNTPPYIHYNGSTTNPDLTLASIDISEVASRKIIDEPGSGHRMIRTAVNFKTKPRTYSNKPHYAWNIKRTICHVD